MLPPPFAVESHRRHTTTRRRTKIEADDGGGRPTPNARWSSKRRRQRRRRRRGRAARSEFSSSLGAEPGTFLQGRDDDDDDPSSPHVSNLFSKRATLEDREVALCPSLRSGTVVPLHIVSYVTVTLSSRCRESLFIWDSGISTNGAHFFYRCFWRGWGELNHQEQFFF